FELYRDRLVGNERGRVDRYQCARVLLADYLRSSSNGCRKNRPAPFLMMPIRSHKVRHPSLENPPSGDIRLGAEAPGQTAGVDLSKGTAFEQARQNLRMLLNALVSLRMSDYRRNPC